MKNHAWKTRMAKTTSAVRRALRKMRSGPARKKFVNSLLFDPARAGCLQKPSTKRFPMAMRNSRKNGECKPKTPFLDFCPACNLERAPSFVQFHSYEYTILKSPVQEIRIFAAKKIDRSSYPFQSSKHLMTPKITSPLLLCSRDLKSLP